MSYLGTAVNYFSSLIKTDPLWQAVNQKWQSLKGLRRAFYFFDIQQGCKLIALFEALVSFVRICWVYYLVYRSDTKSLFPDTQVVRWRSKRILYFLCYHYTNYHFLVGLHLVIIFNSMLLFMGVKRANVVLLYCWIYVSVLTGILTHLNNIFYNFWLSQFFLTVPTLMLQSYCFSIVISLIWKISGMPKSSAVEMEDTRSEVED